MGGGGRVVAEPESKRLNERVSGEEEKLLYIIGGEGRGKAASASGQRLANDAYHGSPCEDSLGYFNDCIYIPGTAPRRGGKPNGKRCQRSAPRGPTPTAGGGRKEKKLPEPKQTNCWPNPTRAVIGCNEAAAVT